MNILFCGGNFRNKGDEAMMLTVVRELTERLPGCNFWLWGHAAEAEHAYASGINPCFRKGGLLRNVAVYLRAFLTRPDVREVALLDKRGGFALAQLPPPDAIVDISGFSYSDVWGPRAAKAAFAWARFCRRRRKPYLCLPQAWGPFKNPHVARWVARFCAQTSMLYVRDSISLTHLSNLLPERRSEIKVAPDIAFKFNGAPPEAGLQLLKSVGFTPGVQPLVALTPNMRVYERTPGQGLVNTYLQFMVRVAEFCMKSLGAAILLIPHEIQVGNGTVRDDRFLCGLLHNALMQKGLCVKLCGNHFAESIKAVYYHVDLLVGSRFHSLVFALSAGVPVLAVGWAHKYAELLRSFALERFVVELPQINDETMKKMLREAWSARAATRHQIQGCLPGIKQQVVGVFQEVVQFINAASKEGHSPGVRSNEKSPQNKL